MCKNKYKVFLFKTNMDEDFNKLIIQFLTQIVQLCEKANISFINQLEYNIFCQAIKNKEVSLLQILTPYFIKYQKLIDEKNPKLFDKVTSSKILKHVSQLCNKGNVSSISLTAVHKYYLYKKLCAYVIKDEDNLSVVFEYISLANKLAINSSLLTSQLQQTPSTPTSIASSTSQDHLR